MAAARKLRVQYPGAIYHVMNRGDRRETIFVDDEDRELFLETLGEACEKTDWQVHAWCLMSNHFHLVSETPRGNLVVDGRQWFLGVYTNRFNHRHKGLGHLFTDDAGLDCPAAADGRPGPCLVLALSEIENRSGSWRWEE
jgi:REP element-mobilizing transposase RayT